MLGFKLDLSILGLGGVGVAFGFFSAGVGVGNSSSRFFGRKNG